MPNCVKVPRANQRYCGECHSRYMKVWRAKRKRDVTKLQSTVVSLRSQLVEAHRKIAELRLSA